MPERNVSVKSPSTQIIRSQSQLQYCPTYLVHVRVASLREQALHLHLPVANVHHRHVPHGQDGGPAAASRSPKKCSSASVSQNSPPKFRRPFHGNRRTWSRCPLSLERFGSLQKLSQEEGKVRGPEANGWLLSPPPGKTFGHSRILRRSGIQRHSTPDLGTAAGALQSFRSRPESPRASFSPSRSSFRRPPPCPLSPPPPTAPAPAHQLLPPAILLRPGSESRGD